MIKSPLFVDAELCPRLTAPQQKTRDRRYFIGGSDARVSKDEKASLRLWQTR
jgi:hypothetical protein